MVQFIGGEIGVVAHDHWSGEKLLLLKPGMRMHPVGAGARLEVVNVALARLERWLGELGHTILFGGWRLAVPMNEGRLIQHVGERQAKLLRRFEIKAMFTLRHFEAEDFCRLALDVEDPGCGRDPGCLWRCYRGAAEWPQGARRSDTGNETAS